jgi:hypothetical protein
MPLPIELFAAFKEFASAKSWPCNGSRPWYFIDAAQVAASILHGLGRPGIVAGTEEDEALRYWLAILGTEEWRVASIRALRLSESPAEGGFSFALDTPGQGFDLGTLGPPDFVVKQLNKWCSLAVADFYVARQDASLSEVPSAPAGVDLVRWTTLWKAYLAHVHIVQQEHQRVSTIEDDKK